nr:phosphatidylserine decarboxylase family protein [Quadrisphaera sp. RL12-1S]
MHPAVQELADFISRNPVVRMEVQRMVEQVPTTRDYRERHLHSVDDLLRSISVVLSSAPEFDADSMVMLPLGGVLDWTTATPAGYALYRDPTVNAELRTLLNAWKEFLDGPDSRYVIADAPGGWKSEAAREAIGIEQFVHDPDDEHWGFASWNDFFTRRFREGQRPVASPDDDAVIVSACESTPYAIRADVAREDEFWVKEQPYSLHDLLAGDPVVDELVGGTVYQAFLSATDYHRWHAPVSGTVVRAFVQPGTYYSEADSEGSDATEPQNSQAYLAHVATRAIIVIDADDPAIGQMAFVGIGMFEVSSCLIDPAVTPGHHLAKGDDLGMFQYGGSTHCLVFRPGAIEGFALQALPRPHDPQAPLVHVRSQIATAAR